MIGIGMKVRFSPSWAFKERPGERISAQVTGKVVYINWEQKYFTAEYDCAAVKQRESFKFSDIGQAVTVYGGY